MKQHAAESRSDTGTQRVVAACYRVYNRLGWGFLEIVYRRALARVLREGGALVVEEAPISVSFEGAVLGEYRADLLVDANIVVEIKAVSRLAPEHRAQVINYLRASNLEVALLLNFGPAPELKRVVFSNGVKRRFAP